jgi:hypothetical protein
VPIDEWLEPLLVVPGPRVMADLVAIDLQDSRSRPGFHHLLFRYRVTPAVTTADVAFSSSIEVRDPWDRRVVSSIPVVVQAVEHLKVFPSKIRLDQPGDTASLLVVSPDGGQPNVVLDSDSQTDLQYRWVESRTASRASRLTLTRLRPSSTAVPVRQSMVITSRDGRHTRQVTVEL